MQSEYKVVEMTDVLALVWGLASDRHLKFAASQGWNDWTWRLRALNLLIYTREDLLCHLFFLFSCAEWLYVWAQTLCQFACIQRCLSPNCLSSLRPGQSIKLEFGFRSAVTHRCVWILSKIRSERLTDNINTSHWISHRLNMDASLQKPAANQNAGRRNRK